MDSRDAVPPLRSPAASTLLPTGCPSPAASIPHDERLDERMSSASAKVTIENKLGLHARPAMLFVETASKFNSTVIVKRCDGEEGVDGKSIMQMMMLAATKGTELEICANGEDSQEAVNQLVKLVKSGFEED